MNKITFSKLAVAGAIAILAMLVMYLTLRSPSESVPNPPSNVQQEQKTYDNRDYGFSFSYPESDAFNPNVGYQYVTDNSLARVDLPASDFAGTNLGEASFIAGASGESTAVEACLKSSPEESATSSSETINGTEMKVFDGVGVGAGNIYETKSYRAVKNGICYEATLLLHSGNIANYEPGAVKEFDRFKFLSSLKKIAATLKIADRVKNIIVAEPKAGDAVGLPLVIKGEARVFENNFVYRIKDADGALLLERNTMAASPDAGVFGPFSVSINYPQPSGATGTVEVFDYSAKDGAETDKTVIPVTFSQTDSIQVSVFFPNTKIDPNMTDCSKVYATKRRIPKTQAIARAAIEELLLGPDRLEADAGFVANMNSGVKINNLTIQSGEAKIDFNETLEANVAGSCRVTSIRSQIDSTLKQFSTINSVIISINGKTDGILQP